MLQNYIWKLDANSPESAYPSCLQTTLASLPLQKSSQTVPQALALHTSTRPSIWLTPPTSLTSPSTQTRGGEGGGRGEGGGGRGEGGGGGRGEGEEGGGRGGRGEGGGVRGGGRGRETYEAY